MLSFPVLAYDVTDGHQGFFDDSGCATLTPKVPQAQRMQRVASPSAGLSRIQIERAFFCGLPSFTGWQLGVCCIHVHER